MVPPLKYLQHCTPLVLSLFFMHSIAAKPLIIDTDMGIDDAIAVLYLLQRPDIEVKAITIAADGSAHCSPALLNTLGLLQLTHHTHIPVACGQDKPLKGNHHFPAWILTESDTLAGVATQLPKGIPQVQGSAVDLLIAKVISSPTPVTLVALGPLTNIAQALQKAPLIKRNIRSIYIMGGALHVPGNIHQVAPSNHNTTAEWNIYIDPVAAQIVFKQKIPIILVPLDLTNQHPIDLNFYKSLKSNHHSPAASFVFTLLKRNFNMIKTKQWYFWDPLAAVIASDPALVILKTERVTIMLKPNNQSGTTSMNSKGAPTAIGLYVNPKAFKKRLVKYLNHHARTPCRDALALSVVHHISCNI